LRSEGSWGNIIIAAFGCCFAYFAYFTCFST
jgi:hypothetical protein